MSPRKVVVNLHVNKKGYVYCYLTSLIINVLICVLFCFLLAFVSLFPSHYHYHSDQSHYQSKKYVQKEVFNGHGIPSSMCPEGRHDPATQKLRTKHLC